MLSLNGCKPSIEFHTNTFTVLFSFFFIFSKVTVLSDVTSDVTSDLLFFAAFVRTPFEYDAAIISYLSSEGDGTETVTLLPLSVTL